MGIFYLALLIAYLLLSVFAVKNSGDIMQLSSRLD